MRTYTGPTLAGGTATVECPDWCVVDHAYWGDNADDMYHRSVELSVLPPGAPAPTFGGVRVPHLTTHLSVHSTETRPCGAVVSVDLSEYKDDGVDLDVAGVDELLARVDTYRAGLESLRDRLASIQKERRTAAS